MSEHWRVEYEDGATCEVLANSADHAIAQTQKFWHWGRSGRDTTLQDHGEAWAVYSLTQYPDPKHETQVLGGES